MWLLDKMLGKLVREGQLVITDHDGKEYRYGPGGGEAIRIRFTDSGVSGHIARNPRLGAGEAYTDGRLVVEPPHDVRDFIYFMTGQAKGGGTLKPRGLARQLFDQAASRLDQINVRSRSSKNAVHHYGLNRQFYELFLDEDRQYSMGYYRDPSNSLEQAQIDKKALIAAKLCVKPGMRVLDIGCGWGGMALFLNRHYGCEVVGVSLAPDQVKFAQERAEAAGVADKVQFRLTDYRDLDEKFDRICSIGMLEHVGKGRFGEYFGKTNQLLAEDGVMLTHTIGRVGPPASTDPWSRKYIFPGHYLPSMSELVEACENTGWDVSDVEELRFHYALTLAEWYRRFTLHREEIVRLYDERLFRMWQFYLVGAEQGFRNSTMVNFQLQTVKQRGAVSMCRDYIETEALRLSAAEPAPEWHLAEAAE
jgi:cyclopropane-fatty-acyl-phospholipid synthase